MRISDWSPYVCSSDLDALGVGAVVAVGRVRHVAAGVAHAGLDDAGQPADEVLHAPEAAAGQNSTLAHLDILHLVEIGTVALGLHCVARNEAQGGGIDAGAQPAQVLRAAGGHDRKSAV